MGNKVKLIFQNMSLSKRLLISFGTILFISAIIVIFSIYFVGRVGSFSHLLFDGPYNSTTAVESIRADINEAGIAIRNGIMEQNIEKYTQDIANARDNALNELETLKNHFKENPQLISDLETAIENFAVQRSKVIDAAKSKDYKTAFEILLTEYQDSFDIAIDRAEKIYTEADKMAISYDQRAIIVTKVAVVFLIAIFIISFIFANFLAVHTTKSVVKPMRELENAAKEMAKGNLKAKVEYISKDEMGSLSNSMRTMIQTLDSYITDISWGMKELSEGNLDITPNIEFYGDFIPLMQNIVNAIISFSDAIYKIDISSEQVKNSSRQIADSGNVLSQSAAEQAGELEMLSETINDISSQISNSAKNALNASDIAKDVGNDIEQSNSNMQEMVNAMNEISNSSDEISKIIRDIEEIAEQTNLLALNAAIEAASAGEAGKGFAVVADEVRKLAAESAKASKNSNVLIDNSLSSVQKGMAVVQQTADSLIEVVNKVRIVVESIDRISKDSKAQADSIEKIVVGIDKISSVVEENTAAIEESAAASQELSSQAQILDDLVRHFNLKK